MSGFMARKRPPQNAACLFARRTPKDGACSSQTMKPAMKIVLGVVLGGFIGYAATRLLGCSTGTCPLTSNPWAGTLYGTLVGGLIGSMLR